MAGAYVGPLLAALQAMEAERAAAQARQIELAEYLREKVKGCDREMREMVDNFTKGF